MLEERTRRFERRYLRTHHPMDMNDRRLQTSSRRFFYAPGKLRQRRDGWPDDVGGGVLHRGVNWEAAPLIGGSALLMP